jgi:hypothetical protein
METEPIKQTSSLWGVVTRRFQIQQPVRWMSYSMAVGALSGLLAAIFVHLLEEGYTA